MDHADEIADLADEMQEVLQAVINDAVAAFDAQNRTAASSPSSASGRGGDANGHGKSAGGAGGEHLHRGLLPVDGCESLAALAASLSHLELLCLSLPPSLDLRMDETVTAMDAATTRSSAGPRGGGGGWGGCGGEGPGGGRAREVLLADCRGLVAYVHAVEEQEAWGGAEALQGAEERERWVHMQGSVLGRLQEGVRRARDTLALVIAHAASLRTQHERWAAARAAAAAREQREARARLEHDREIFTGLHAVLAAADAGKQELALIARGVLPPKLAARLPPAPSAPRTGHTLPTIPPFSPCVWPLGAGEEGERASESPGRRSGGDGCGAGSNGYHGVDDGGWAGEVVEARAGEQDTWAYRAGFGNGLAFVGA